MRVKIDVEVHRLFAEAMLEWAQDEFERWPGDAYRAELSALINQLADQLEAAPPDTPTTCPR